MKEVILERSLMNVNSVASVSDKQQCLGCMKEFTLERGLMNVNIVASVFNGKEI